jgi:hypothetical protein
MDFGGNPEKFVAYYVFFCFVTLKLNIHKKKKLLEETEWETTMVRILTVT